MAKNHGSEQTRMAEHVTIIMIEDDEGHARLIEKNIRRAGVSNEIKHFTDGTSALHYLFGENQEGSKTLGGALLVAGGSGAGIGAIAGHIGRKTPSKDLEAISETLDAGSAGIVFVVDPAEAVEVEALLTNATRVTRRALAVDSKELDEEVDGAYQ